VKITPFGNSSEQLSLTLNAGFRLKQIPHSYSGQKWQCSPRNRLKSPQLGLLRAKTLS